MVWNGIIMNLCSYIFFSFDQSSEIFFLGQIDSEIAWHWVVLSLMRLIGIWLTVASYQLLDPTICTIFIAQEVVFAYIFEATLLDFVPCFISFIGAFMVVLSAVCIPLEEFIVPKLPKIF